MDVRCACVCVLLFFWVVNFNFLRKIANCLRSTQHQTHLFVPDRTGIEHVSRNNIQQTNGFHIGFATATIFNEFSGCFGQAILLMIEKNVALRNGIQLKLIIAD